MSGLFHRTFFAAGVASLGATGVASAGPLSANPVYLTTEHIDLNIGYSGGVWSLGPRVESNPPAEYAGEDAVLYVHPLAKETAPGSLAFTGAAAGEDLYVLPQSQVPKLLYLGTSAYGADSGTFDRWSPATESKGRITGLARYLRLGLAQVKGPGEFSVWATESFGNIIPYMSSYNDGVANPNGAGLDHTDGVSSDDALWLPTGGHVHFNFGFTRPGLYEVQVNAAGHLEDGVTGTTGPRVSSATPFSIYFNVHPNYAKAGLVNSSALPDRGDVAIGAYGTLHSTAITAVDSGSIDVTGAGAAEEIYVLLDLVDPSLAGAVAVATNGFEPPPETGLGPEDAVPSVAVLDPSLLAQYGAYAGGSYDVALRYGLPPGTMFDFEFDFASILDGVEVTNVGVVAVPEPSSLLVGMAGIAGLLLRRTKRRNVIMPILAAMLWLAGATNGAFAALQPGYVTVDDIHVDLAMPLIRANVSDAGTWQPHIHTGSYTSSGWNNYAPDAALLVVNPTTLKQRTGNLATPTFDFLGVAPGQRYFGLSSNPIPGQLYLGVEGDSAPTPTSGNSAPFPARMLASDATNWGSWDPDGPGGTASGRRIEIALKAVRYAPDPSTTAATDDAAAQGAYFSAWSFGTFGTLNLKMASSNGIDGSDEFHEIIRSHSHYNWAFSKSGFYEIDLQARTFYGSGGGAFAGTETISPITTFHFSVVPEPASCGLALLAGSVLFARRRRKGEAALAVALCAACAMTPARQATAAVYSMGHADVGVAIEGGQLSLFYNFDGSSVIDGVELGGPPGSRYPHEPSGVITRLVHEPVPRPANFSGPPDYNWDFIGNGEGDPVWYIPEVQSDAPDRPWLGFGTERLNAGDIVGDVAYEITDFDGPGEFAMFFSDPLGVPQVQFSTGDDDLTYSLQAGTHAHFMWTFTAPGTYQIELTATVTPTGGGGPISDTETFTFEVANVPEPASLSVLGAGGLALLLRKRKGA